MKGIAALLNGMSDEAARAALDRCCGSARWMAAMAERRPFASDDAVCAAAAETWWSLGREDWLAAFARHPRIGERSAGWSGDEQRGAADAPAGVLAELRAANASYEDRFGHVFLICASGLDAGTMLDALRERIHNDPEEELRIAAREQIRITMLRLGRLVEA